MTHARKLRPPVPAPRQGPANATMRACLRRTRASATVASIAGGHARCDARELAREELLSEELARLRSSWTRAFLSSLFSESVLTVRVE